MERHWDEHWNEHRDDTGRAGFQPATSSFILLTLFLLLLAGWKPALPVFIPVLLPVFIPLVGRLFRASTASLPPARESNGKVNYHTYFFYMSVIDKSKDVTKMLNSYTNDFVVIKISKNVTLAE